MCVPRHVMRPFFLCCCCCCFFPIALTHPWLCWLTSTQLLIEIRACNELGVRISTHILTAFGFLLRLDLRGCFVRLRASDAVWGKDKAQVRWTSQLVNWVVGGGLGSAVQKQARAAVMGS